MLNTKTDIHESNLASGLLAAFGEGTSRGRISGEASLWKFPLGCGAINPALIFQFHAAEFVPSGGKCN
jgi:hypothetical protein